MATELFSLRILPLPSTGLVLQDHGLLPWAAIPAAVPPGLLITAIMVVNNLRDIDTDRKAGKNTLAVILGSPRTITEYKLLLLSSYFIPPAMMLTGVAGTLILF